MVAFELLLTTRRKTNSSSSGYLALNKRVRLLTRGQLLSARSECIAAYFCRCFGVLALKFVERLTLAFMIESNRVATATKRQTS